MSEDKSAPKSNDGQPAAAAAAAATVDKAAAKIQAGFRGYRVRKRLQQERDKAHGEQQHQQQYQTPDEVQQRNGFDKEQQCYMEEEVMLEPQPLAPVTMEDKSATKIQAGIRGFLVRKRQQAEQAAATKIQAGFRGFRTRKLLKQTGQ